MERKHKAQNVGHRLVRLGCVAVTSIVAWQFVVRAPAQRIAGNPSTVGNANQISIVSSGITNSSKVLSTAGCAGSPLWAQYNSVATEPPTGVGSQKFEPAMTAFDDQVADDFVLTPGFGAIYVAGVRVMGEYSNGGGPASSFNVYFYENAAGNVPGSLIVGFENLAYAGPPPDFVICLPYGFGMAPGTYWVSVQARQDFNPNGQWFWHNRTVQSNAGAVWQNPGNGYGTGCTTWSRKNLCMPDQVWPDQVFEILGFREGPTPSPKPIPTPRPRPTPVPRPTA